MPPRIVDDRILFDDESKQRATPTSVHCHCNIRDDKTAIELFLTGIWGWEAGLRRKLENGKSG
jgi:hypothetical protein